MSCLDVDAPEDDPIGSHREDVFLDRLKSVLEDQFDKQEFVIAKCIDDSVRRSLLLGPAPSPPAGEALNRSNSKSGRSCRSWPSTSPPGETLSAQARAAATAHSDATEGRLVAPPFVAWSSGVTLPTPSGLRDRQWSIGTSDISNSSAACGTARVEPFSVVPGSPPDASHGDRPPPSRDGAISRSPSGRLAKADSFIAEQTAEGLKSVKRRRSTRRLSTAATSRRRMRMKFEENSTPGDRIWSRFLTKCNEWYDWWVELEEPERTGRVAKFVHSRYMERLTTLVIAMNTGFSIYSANYELEHSDATGVDVIRGFEQGFLFFYSVELLLKLIAHQIFFFCNHDMAWNWFDLFLVLQSAYEELVIVLGHTGGTSLVFMRTLRVLKIAKVLRVVRVLRFFTELRLIMNSLIGSIISMFWSFVMLAFIFLFFGLVFVQGAAAKLHELHPSGETVEDNPHMVQLLSDFGSVETAMFSLYKAVTGGQDWEVYSDSMEYCGGLYISVFVFFIGFFQIAVINILTGIFVEHAMKLAMPDRDTRALEHRRDEVLAFEELAALLYDMDANLSGTISAEEFSEKLNMNNGKFRSQLALLGLHVTDADLFFNTVAERCRGSAAGPEDEVDIAMFVANCMRLKGYATNLDLQCVTGEILKLADTLRTHRFLLEQTAATTAELKEQCEEANAVQRRPDLVEGWMPGRVPPLPPAPRPSQLSVGEVHS